MTPSPMTLQDWDLLTLDLQNPILQFHTLLGRLYQQHPILDQLTRWLKKGQVLSTCFQIEIFRGVILSLTYGLGTLWGWSTNTSHDQFMTVRTWRPGISPDHFHPNISFVHVSIPMYQVIFHPSFVSPLSPASLQEPDAPGVHLRRDRFWKRGGAQLFFIGLLLGSFIRPFH